MSDEDKLAEQISKIQQLAQENKDIDASALIANVLAQHKENAIPSGQKARAYMISTFIPPAGVYYFIKYIFQDSTEAKRVAWISLSLTIAPIIATWYLASQILSSSPGFQQIQNIDLKQIQELTQ